jgi:hypothetical protein
MCTTAPLGGHGGTWARVEMQRSLKSRANSLTSDVMSATRVGRCSRRSPRASRPSLRELPRIAPPHRARSRAGLAGHRPDCPDCGLRRSRRGFDIRVVKWDRRRLEHPTRSRRQDRRGPGVQVLDRHQSEARRTRVLLRLRAQLDSAGLWKVNGFKDSGKAVKGCRGSADIFRPRRDVMAFVGPRCLDRPSRVRVSVQLAAKGPDDWALGFREFSRWISRY